MELMMNSSENKMGTMGVNKLLLTMGLPMMLSMLVQALYNVVDSIFVSRICEDALTAVSMSFPMQNLLIGLGTGLGVGTNAILSKRLGEKNGEAADRTAMQGVFLSLLAYLLFLILGLTVVRPFFRLQGANEVITEYGVRYLSIVTIFSFGCFAQLIFERLLQGTGRTLYSMFSQGLGAIINIILDPIMIFGLLGFPELGISGAAIATVTGQMVAGLFAIILNIRKNTDIHLKLKNMLPQKALILNIIRIGLPSVIMVAVGSVMTFSVNKIIVVFTSTAVAVFGVYFKLQSFVFMPVFGMNNAMIPIIGFNFGARKPERIVQTVKYGIIYAEAMMILFMAFVHLFPVPLLRLFNATETMLAMGVPALRIISVSFVFAGFCVITSSYLQAMGMSTYSMIISITRQMVFLVPCVYFLSKTGNVNLVWLAWPIAEIASLITCLYYRRKVNKKLILPMYER